VGGGRGMFSWRALVASGWGVRERVEVRIEEVIALRCWWGMG